MKEDSAANSGLASEGTLAWMAPELFSTRPKFSVKSDIYSFGMIMWEVASRDTPYRGARSHVIGFCVQDGEREQIPEDCPKGFAELVEKCWHKDATERPFADDVLSELSRITLVMAADKTPSPEDFRPHPTPTPKFVAASFTSETAQANPQPGIHLQAQALHMRAAPNAAEEFFPGVFPPSVMAQIFSNSDAHTLRSFSQACSSFNLPAKCFIGGLCSSALH